MRRPPRRCRRTAQRAFNDGRLPNEERKADACEPEAGEVPDEDADGIAVVPLPLMRVRGSVEAAVVVDEAGPEDEAALTTAVDGTTAAAAASSASFVAREVDLPVLSTYTVS